MRRLLIALVVAMTVVGLGSGLMAQVYKVNKQQLKERQKSERKALKLKQKYTHQSMKGRNFPKSVRDQMKHQEQREKRELRERQKDERQDIKDRERSMKEMQSRR